ncbi:MAG TPA: sugar ABC transporter permease [Anaerolineae bacterium]|nr:sugar ABC transporter permease [Anaerolineae bacterium]
MKGKGWERWAAVLMVLPSIILIAIFVYAFIGFTGYVSLTKWASAAPDFTFVGLNNYARILFGAGIETQRFYIDIRNFVGFTSLFLLACLIIGFGLALVLDSRIRGENFFRSVFLLPFAISFIVTGVVWRWLLTPGTPELGATGVNKLFEYIGLGFFKPRWFTDPTVLYIHADAGVGLFLNQIGLKFLTSPTWGISVGTFSIVIAATWQLSGYVMALYLAGLRSIPQELREAARVDGANEYQVVRYIYLPLLTPITLSVVIILSSISLKLYDLTVAMTGVGPGFSTDTLAFNMFETTFKATRFAQGAAIAIILLVLVSILIIPYLRYSLKSETAV